MAATSFQLDVEKILANINSRIIIAGALSRPVVCFLQEGLGFSAGNVFGNAFESQALANVADKYNKASSVIGAGAAMVGVDTPNQIGPQLFFNTTESWSGPQKPSFSIKTTFVAVKPTDNVTADVKVLMEACFPTGELTGLMKVPLNYGPALTKGKGLSVEGTVNMQIGTWFKATGLIVESVHPKFSAQVIKNGKPLYCEVEMTLKPYRAITYGEFTSYFIS